jgi:hypothetical protein
MMRRLFGLALLCLIAIGSPVRAKDLFVDNVHGDDDRDGTTPVTSGLAGGPVRSLMRGLDVAQAGDRIVMANNNEPYRESVTLCGGRHSSLGSEPFVIEGNGAVLEGSRPVPAKAWEHYRGDVFRFQPQRSSFAQIFLYGPPAVRRYLDDRSGSLPRLMPREWCLAGGMIYFRVDQGALPDEYPLAFAALSVGITMYEVHGAVIRDLTVQGFQLDGINAHDCAKDCTLERVISRGNGRAGIAVGGASSVRIDSCLVSDNGIAQILTSGPSATAIEQTEVDAASAPGLIRQGGRVFLDGRDLAGALNAGSGHPDAP